MSCFRDAARSILSDMPSAKSYRRLVLDLTKVASFIFTSSYLQGKRNLLA